MRKIEKIFKKFTKEEIENIIKNSTSYRNALINLGMSEPDEAEYNFIKNYVKSEKIDVSHYTGKAWKKNNFDYSRFRYGIVIKSKLIVDALIYKRGHRCESCGLENWLDNPIPLEVHHIDGDKLNNVESNLSLLCPNCHALTENYRGKNINKFVRKCQMKI